MNEWRPTSIQTVFGSVPSSTSPVHVDTDAGQGYLKAMGNNEGPHALAREWVGTHLADWFGLKTFDVAIIDVMELDELELQNGRMAEVGPAFISRYEIGESWSGTELELRNLDNPETISRLIVFDTWIRNVDRHSISEQNGIPHTRRNVKNVFLSADGASKGKVILKAIDHTHCFLTSSSELTPRIKNLEYANDPAIYGRFPEFTPHLDRAQVHAAAEKLHSIQQKYVERIVSQIPTEWDVSQPTKSAWIEHIHRRATFVADRIEDRLFPQKNLLDRDEP